MTDSGTYVLDTGVVVGLQKSGHLGVLANAARAVRIVLVEDVYDELTAPRGGKRAVEAKDAKALIDASDVKTESILMGSPMADAYESLRTGRHLRPQTSAKRRPSPIRPDHHCSAPSR